MLNVYLQALVVVLIMGVVTWGYSVKKQNVNSVDSLWSLMFLVAAAIYLLANDDISVRAGIVFVLVCIWSLRLSIHLTVRNWNHAEDRRYQQIRSNNQPNFRFKSLYIIFGLQAVLAWLISIPLLLALTSSASLGWLDGFAIGLWLVGFVFEALADYQLVKFKQSGNSRDRVLDSGLWAYTRHPNYFGEFCMWWAFYLFALSAGGWWTVYAPLLMSFLLLKVSGVVMLEKDISSRRPQYRHYIESTPAFFPGPKKRIITHPVKEQKI